MNNNNNHVDSGNRLQFYYKYCHQQKQDSYNSKTIKLSKYTINSPTYVVNMRIFYSYLLISHLYFVIVILDKILLFKNDITEDL